MIIQIRLRAPAPSAVLADALVAAFPEVQYCVAFGTAVLHICCIGDDPVIKRGNRLHACCKFDASSYDIGTGVPLGFRVLDRRQTVDLPELFDVFGVGNAALEAG